MTHSLSRLSQIFDECVSRYSDCGHDKGGDFSPGNTCGSLKSKSDHESIKKKAKHLHDTAGHPSTKMEDIEALEPELSSLSKSSLVDISKELGMVGMESKSKSHTKDQIMQRIKSIKQSQMRVSIIDRPKGKRL